MMPKHNASQWYMAQIKPNCASLATSNLARQGFEVFLPLERITQRQGKRFIAAKRPYFPGYLFVGIGAESAPWLTIDSTQGVARLVQFGGQPTPVPPAVVDDLRQACDAEGCITTQASLTSGDDVRIAAGPFADFIGRVEQLAPNSRAWVLLDVMGKATRTEILSGDLRLVS